MPKITVNAVIAAIDAAPEPLSIQQIREAVGAAGRGGRGDFNAVGSIVCQLSKRGVLVQTGELRAYRYGPPFGQTAAEAQAAYLAKSTKFKAGVAYQKKAPAQPAFLLGEVWK